MLKSLKLIIVDGNQNLKLQFLSATFIGPVMGCIEDVNRDMFKDTNSEYSQNWGRVTPLSIQPNQA